jgi:uncharacterized protein YjbJ (UPF0337 family)
MTGATPRSHDFAGAGRSRATQQKSRIQRMEPMDWSRISGNWTHWRGRVRERWGKLTDDQLDVIAGRREQLAGRIQELYGLQRDEAERQLLNWERNLSVEMDPTQHGGRESG